MDLWRRVARNTVVRQVAAGVVAAQLAVWTVGWLWQHQASMPYIALKPKTPDERLGTPVYPIQPLPYPGDADEYQTFLSNRRLLGRPRQELKPQSVQAREESRAAIIWQQMRRDLAEELVRQGDHADVLSALSADDRHLIH